MWRFCLTCQLIDCIDAPCRKKGKDSEEQDVHSIDEHHENSVRFGQEAGRLPSHQGASVALRTRSGLAEPRTLTSFVNSKAEGNRISNAWGLVSTIAAIQLNVLWFRFLYGAACKLSQFWNVDSGKLP